MSLLADPIRRTEPFTATVQDPLAQSLRLLGLRTVTESPSIRSRGGQGYGARGTLTRTRSFFSQGEEEALAEPLRFAP
jgi:hypothetical protein